jgi:undecaprenyl-diphosphatase
VYLTLAVVLAHLSRRPVVRAYLLCCSAVLTGLVGISRVYLGVHYPTDVLAGWAVGLTWALLCGLVAGWFRRPRRAGTIPAARRTP